MTENRESTVGGDRRGRDRRGSDRRKVDRRAPVPLWRRPAAYAAYGVVGALLVVFVLLGLEGEAAPPEPLGLEAEPASTPPAELPAVLPGEVRDANSLGAFEALIAEGDRAVGEMVRVDLYCGSIGGVGVRDVRGAHPALEALADADGRVSAAECRWSSDARSSDLMLVVPPSLVSDFAAAPEVEMNFVRRREIPAHVEWLGRSEALSLRYSGILREIVGS